jgi:hypothetical protein
MKMKLTALISGLLVIVLIMGYGKVTATANPGDANDPLVTRRYVDDQIASLRALIGQSGSSGGGISAADRDYILAEVIAYIDAVYGGTFHSAPPSAVQQAPFEAVFARAGRTIIGVSGTEMILRGGRAIALTGEHGLCNVTTGIDVVNGDEIILNHLHLVPFTDGRGMHFIEDSYLMIKGDYYFVD